MNRNESKSLQGHFATKEDPYIATMLKRRSLHHSRVPIDQARTFEILLSRDQSRLSFQAGDSLAIATENPSITTGPYLHLFEKKQSTTNLCQDALEHAFTHSVELSKLPSFNFQKLAKLFCLSEEEAQSLQEGANALYNLSFCEKTWSQSLLYRALAFTLEYKKEIWSRLDLKDFLSCLPKLAPRLYSIASSPSTEKDEIRLMVGHHRHPQGLWYGACSHSLCYEKQLGSQIKTWIHPARRFHDPDPNRDLVMIGAGTGLAPYRSFLLERENKKNSSAKHWLFFGERHENEDFYYRDLWDQLSIELKVTTAFSRDQKEKVYVQHRLWEEKEAIWKCIEEGALFMLCGDAHHMAKDVEATLCRIAETAGKIEDTKTWLRQLVRSGQLLKDVY